MKGTDPFYSSNAWRELRYKALKRDHWKCTICERSVRGKGESRVDHVEPRRKRPDLALVLSNLRTLCIDCDAKRHSAKGGNHVERMPVAIDGLPSGWR
jgi:5-methylcytosine-specific restriction endonuclease McrA